jgi:hypothetical protein
MRLVRVLMGRLRMLFRGVRVFLALGVVTLAVMFRGRTVGFCRVFVVLGRLVVFVSCHGKPRWLFAPSPD